MVRTFKRKGGVKTYLYCGGPKYSADPAWGYRHIKKEHRDDWERKARSTFQGWRELADLSIAAVLADPVVAGSVRSGKRCYSRYVYLVNTRTGRVSGTMIVRVIWRASDNTIITAYPSSSGHC